MNIVYRDGVDSDIPMLIELEEEVFKGDAYDYHTLKYFIGRSDYFRVALDGDIIVGYILCESMEGVGHIISIGVRGRYRGMGIGSRLLGDYIRAARARGLKRIYLEVSVNRVDAVNFYTRHGFRVTGRIPRYYSDGSDAYLMEMDLE